MVAVGPDPHTCDGFAEPSGLRAQADPGPGPSVTWSQAFDLPVPLFPQMLNGHDKLGRVAIVM